MTSEINSKKLIHTTQGRYWLNQFDPIDKEAATLLSNNLTLVSHTEFERNLLAMLEIIASSIEGTVGFFTIRELQKEKVEKWQNEKVIPFYSQVIKSKDGKSVNALSSSSDQGSESRVANIIRQLCKTNSQKYLNHPTLESLRNSKSDSIILVDDFIGSGRRVYEFLEGFWGEPSIVSWLSGKQLNLNVVSYSGMDSGIDYIKKHKSKPQVHIFRDAPSIESIAWSQENKLRVLALCKKYGRIANKKRKSMWLGYRSGMATIIFEHGCPNNTPSILWESNFKGNGWKGLFPNRTISSAVASVFPLEIARRDHVQILVDVGQKQLAKSGALIRRGEAGQVILIILALIAKGHKKRSKLSFAASLNVAECEKVINICIKWNFITAQRRITAKGLAELKAAKKSKLEQFSTIDIGSDFYYPSQLREATHE